MSPARYLRSATTDGRPLDVQDPLAAQLQELAVRGGNDPRPLLGRTDLGCDGAVVAALASVLVELDHDGLTAVLTTFCTGDETGSTPHVWGVVPVEPEDEGSTYVAAS